MKAFMGIDPGQSGGIAIMSMAEYNVIPMPTNEDGGLDLHTISSIFAQNAHRIERCVIEKVHSMPKQGVSSTFKFGQGFGALEALLVAYQIPYKMITPQKWQKCIFADIEGETTKDKSRKAAQRLYPLVDFLATPRSKKLHDGMTDAACMAEYARIM